MSSLWTPGGERPIPRPSPDDPPKPAAGPSGPSRPAGADRPGPDGGEPLSEDEARQRMAELTAQLAATPAEVVIANHAYGLFELAALHLSLERPQLDQARVAIDALGCLVEGLGDRLGDAAGDLETALAQLRMAFVQVSAALRTEPGPSGGEAPG